ncbi:MAG: Hsp20/alpha crystallin family protein [Woeseiaceae bacterium]
MNVTRFEPWTLLNLLQRDLDRFAGRRYGADDIDHGAVADWTPAVDILEEKDRFVLRADLPGVSPEEIDISMEKGVLSLSGERRQEKSTEVDGVKRVERLTGKFYRRFTLPETANAEKISARSANGILEVTIPKLPEVQARRITVQAA